MYESISSVDSGGYECSESKVSVPTIYVLWITELSTS